MAFLQSYKKMRYLMESEETIMYFRDIYTLYVIIHKNIFRCFFFKKIFNFMIYFKDYFKGKLFKEEFIVRNICPLTSP